MKQLQGIFLYAILASVGISLGGTMYLQIINTFDGSNIIAAFLFAIGLFIICTRGYYLYTGRICYVFQGNIKVNLIQAGVIWVGNMLGCCIFAFLLSLTNLAPKLAAGAVPLIENKLGMSYLSMFILAILCNICIYVAVNGYVKTPHEIGKYLALFFGVSGFILAGTEHSIADAYFFLVSGAFATEPLECFIRVLIVTAGNSVGGVILPNIERWKEHLDHQHYLETHNYKDD